MTQPTPIPEATPSTPAPAAPAESTQETTPESEAPVEYIQLRRNQIYADLSKLDSEDEEVRRVLGTYVGKKASSQYRPQIAERDAKIARLESENFKLEVRGMDEKAIEAKITSDRDWGKRYLDLVHEERNGNGQPAPVDERPLVESALSEIMDYGRRNGLSEADWNQFVTKAQSGAYGNDSWQLGLTRMQQDVADFIHKGRGAAPPPLQKTNPALAKGGADLSSGDRTGANVSGAFPTTAKEFNALPRDRQTELIRSDRDKVLALSKK